MSKSARGMFVSPEAGLRTFNPENVMRAKFTLLYVIAAVAACTSTATNADSTSAASNTTAASDDQSRSAIEKIRTGWRESAGNKDSTTVASYYADDAVMAVSEAPVAEGKAAIEKTLGRMVNMTKINSIDSKELVVHGDDAYDYGTYSQTATLPNGKTADQNGYYIVTLHRGADGTWKITRHLGVSPPAAH